MIFFTSYNDILRKDLEIGLFLLRLDGGALANKFRNTYIMQEKRNEKKYDKTYKKLNPIIKLEDKYKVKKVIKYLFSWFNKKYFDYSIEPMILEIEKI